jgi:LSD1 subclass zinc finger protein
MHRGSVKALNGTNPFTFSWGRGSLANLSTGGLLLVIGIVLTIVGIVFFPLLCVGVPLALVGVIVLVAQGGKVTQEPTAQAGFAAYPAVTPRFCEKCGRPMMYHPPASKYWCANCQRWGDAV